MVNEEVSAITVTQFHEQPNFSLVIGEDQKLGEIVEENNAMTARQYSLKAMN